MATYTVVQGDTMLTIAQKNGFGDWERVWQHAKNAGLRAERPNPMVLAPGDLVFLPEKDGLTFTRPTTATHTFKVRRKKPPCDFSICVKDDAGNPYKGCKYELTLGDDAFTGQVPDDGWISHPVAPDVQTGELKLWPVADDADETFTWPLRIGHLDPVDTVAGVQARLNNLGYRAGPPDGTLTDITREAIASFQLRAGFDVGTGEIDDRTRRALLAAHGGV